MNRRLFLSLVALLGTGVMRADLKPPAIGLVRYGDGTVASVSGLTGNYIIHPSSLPPADGLSSASGGALLSKDGQISLLSTDLSVTASYQSGERQPVLNIDERTDSAIAWLPGQQAFVYWNGHSWVTTPPITQIGSAQVTSVWRRDATTAGLLAQTPEGAVWDATIVLNSGELTGLTHLAGVHSPAFHSAQRIVFQEGNTLHVQSADGLQKTYRLSSGEQLDLTFERLSAEDIHVASRTGVAKTPSQDWVLHLGKTETQLTELPGIPSLSPAGEAK